MADTHETIADIIGEARDKYTVHNCNECNYRKSCDWNDWNFGSVECEAKRQSISLLLGIDDDYFNKLLTRLEAAHKRELSKNVSKNGADFGQLGDCAKLREAVKAVVDVGYPHNFQREAPHIRGYCYDITRAIEKCLAALAAPPRNCDVGTVEEQLARHNAWCRKYGIDGDMTVHCAHPDMSCGLCTLRWAQMPYEEGRSI